MDSDSKYLALAGVAGVKVSARANAGRGFAGKPAPTGWLCPRVGRIAASTGSRAINPSCLSVFPLTALDLAFVRAFVGFVVKMVFRLSGQGVLKSNSHGSCSGASSREGRRRMTS